MRRGLGIRAYRSTAIPPPTYSLDFTAGALPGSVTFTRSTSGSYFNSSGVLSSAAINAPRFDYNPTTLAPLGLLIEEQRTNSIRNNTMQGAVAGTPGTAPTNWVVPGPINGLTQEFVGVGAENGITYIDVKFSGTTSAASSHAISFEAANQIAASSGQSWNRSAWFKVVAGSTANLTVLNFNLQGRNAANTAFTETFAIDIAPSLTSTLTRLTATATLADVSTAFVRSQLQFFYNTGLAVNITLRIGLPQLELGAFATSVIPTTTTALTRAADVASVTGANFSSWYNAVEGTALIEASTLPNVTTAVLSYAISDGTFNQSIYGNFSGGNAYRGANVLDGGVGQTLSISTFTGITTTNNTKDAFAYKVNDFAESCNGVATRIDTSGTVPIVNRLYVGTNWNASGNFLNGYIRSFKYYSTRLPNINLQTLTS